jgi:hypothetical protein
MHLAKFFQEKSSLLERWLIESCLESSRYEIKYFLHSKENPKAYEVLSIIVKVIGRIITFQVLIYFLFNNISVNFPHRISINTCLQIYLKQWVNLWKHPEPYLPTPCEYSAMPLLNNGFLIF